MKHLVSPGKKTRFESDVGVAISSSCEVLAERLLMIFCNFVRTSGHSFQEGRTLAFWANLDLRVGSHHNIELNLSAVQAASRNICAWATQVWMLVLSLFLILRVCL
jgi:hypothetical protein